MKAHKVPATYLAGWEIPTLKNRIYVFNKTELDKSGVTKRYRIYKSDNVNLGKININIS